MSSPESPFFTSHPLFILNKESLEILDVNACATQWYGCDRQAFIGMNIRDLGEKKDRRALIGDAPEAAVAGDIIWVHEDAEGVSRYVQFTTHTFNYHGIPAIFAVAHDVTAQIKRQDTAGSQYPKIELFRGDRPLAEITWTADGNVINWSQKAEALFGWSREQAMNQPDFWKRFIHQDDYPEAAALVEQKVQAAAKEFTALGKVKTRKGQTRVCEWYNTLIYDETGRLHRIYSLLQDVSEREEKSHLFRALSEKSLVGVYLIQDDEFKYVNPRFAEIFGYRQDEIEGEMGPMDLTHPDDRKRVSENLEERISGKVDALEYDFRCTTKQGDTIHVKVIGSRMTYLGRPAVVGTLLDLTHSKLAYERYQSSVESFEDLFDSISDAIYIQNRRAEFIKVNEAALALNGYSREEMIGRTPDFLAAPGKVDLEEIRRYFERALGGTPQRFEQWGIKKSGEVFPEEVILNPGTYFGEEVVIAISRDITDRYEAETEVQHSREKFHQLFSNAPIGIAMIDQHQEISTINKAFEEIFGYEEQEIAGLDINRVIVPEEEMEEARYLSQQNMAGYTFSSTETRTRKDGSLIEVLVYGVPVTVEGQTIAVFGIYVDMSDRKEAEEKVKKSLREKEVLLAEIHHRVKNNLAVITGLLELQQYNTELDEAREVLRESQLRINSIALIHEKLYQNENLSQISIDVYLNELIAIITDSMNTGETAVDIQVESEPAFLTINQAIPCGLILNELITNSFKHAFPEADRGTIDIKLVKQGCRVEFEYADDGVGIPDGVALDAPSSLGLTLIQTLSRQLQGQHQFYRTGQGMRFSLEFRIDE